jgi:para-aminobenzoate synthetase / 4-amino-4-deoxychorismate lyase
VNARPVASTGLIETMLVYAGRPVELDAHLARLEASLACLFGAPLPERAEALVRAHASGVALGRLRLTVAPALATVHVAEIPQGLVFPGWEQALRLRPLELHGGVGSHKWADRRLLAAEERRSGAGALPLLLDADGAVLEASRANVFLVTRGVVVTPRADGRLLPGVARRRVLDLAAEAGVDVREAIVTLGDLAAADEVFLTGSVRGIEPVRGCDGAAEWWPGPIAPLLSERLRRLWIRTPVKEAMR